MSDNVVRSQLKIASDDLLESALAKFEAQKIGDSVTKSNAILMGILDSVEALYNKKEELNKHLAASYFSLMCARKSHLHKLSIEDAREEIEAGVRLQEVREEGAGWVQMEGNVDDLESLCLLSGLPSAKLRSCQREFQKALDMVMEVDRLTREVEAQIASKKSDREQ
jgi:hypothetical protein